MALINGTNGRDTLDGTGDPDQINGRAGADVAYGRGGADDISGGPGRDWLAGNGDRDAIRGGLGADTLIGGPGGDWLDGGAGADTFVFDTFFGRGAVDTIVNFRPGVDTIEIDLSATGLSRVFRPGDLDPRRFIEDGDDFGGFPMGPVRGRPFGDDGEDDGRPGPGGFGPDSFGFGGNDGGFDDGGFRGPGDDGNRIRSLPSFVYDSDTGTLSYDANPNDSFAGVRIATLVGAPDLSAQDITLVA